MNSDEINQYIIGIAKSTFCKPAVTSVTATASVVAISLAHFVSLQPRECMFVKDSFVPEAKIINGILYFWMPTPGKGKEAQITYAKAARECISQLANEDFSEIIIDVRNNIGGVLSTFINSILPFVCHDPRFNVFELRSDKSESLYNTFQPYMFGINKDGKQECRFVIEGTNHRIMFDNDSLDDELIPIEITEKDRFAGKKIHVICNKYTMSSGEIICIIMRMLGHKIYGEKTRGLTNGCRSIESSTVKSALIPYYIISDGKIIYPDGVKPDYPESAALKLLN